MTHATFPVHGMSCAHCVGTVTAALVRVEGIADPVVDLDNASATVTAIDDAAVAAAKRAVVEAGYAVDGAAESHGD